MKKILTILLVLSALGACTTGGRTEKEEFIVDLNSPQIPMGGIDVQMDKTFPLPGIRKINVTMSYFPIEDAVCLQYRVDLMTYFQFWSRSGRAAFIKALEEYKEDYAARDLERRGGARARRKYGNVEGYLIWQLSRYTTQAKSSVNIELGYSFQENSPYFLVNQREAYYLVSQQESRDTQQKAMYFTRAQADELAVFFNQEYLQGLSPVGAFNEDTNYDEYDNKTEIQSENGTQTEEY